MQAVLELANDNYWQFRGALSPQRHIHRWTAGFTNVPTAVLVDALTSLGIEVIDAEDLL